MAQPSQPRFRRWINRNRRWILVLLNLMLALFLVWYLTPLPRFPYPPWLQWTIVLGVVSIAAAINYVVSGLSRNRKWVLGLVGLLMGLALGVFVVWYITNPPLPAGLGNTQWTLQAVQVVGGSVLWTSGDPSRFYLKFTDTSLEGTAGCNALSGGYFLMRFSNYLSMSVFRTLIGCMPPYLQRENEFLYALETATKYELSSHELRIYYDNATKVLIFNNQAK
jgi:heat shock protein HslJ